MPEPDNFVFLFDGPEAATHTILLAHGAGGAMDSPAMDSLAQALATAGLRVARFEFAYMAGRREGRRAPPPRAETLCAAYKAAVDALGVDRGLIIGGKSMGGRVASLVADTLYADRRIVGLLCLGYPFHPVGKPDQLRTKHLLALQTPTLIVQGTRDPFGTPTEVAGYHLSPAIDVLWLADGDHDLKPRKRVSGFTVAQHRAALGSAVSTWAGKLAAGRSIVVGGPLG